MITQNYTFSIKPPSAIQMSSALSILLICWNIKAQLDVYWSPDACFSFKFASSGLDVETKIKV